MKIEADLPEVTQLLYNNMVKFRNFFAIAGVSCALLIPQIISAAKNSTVTSMDTSIDDVVIKNTDLSGKISFLPVIRNKDIKVEVGLGACWDGEPYEIRVDDRLNGQKTIITGNAPSKNECYDWFNAASAAPAEYTIHHNREKFAGQAIYLHYNGDTPDPQILEIRVYEDSEREKSTSQLNNKYKGYVMLKAEDQGQLYYISPVSKKAYYIVIPKHTMQIIKGTGIGITNKDLEKIPVGGSCPPNIPRCDKPERHDQNYANKYKGYIFLQVEENGEAWYVYPKDGKRYYLGTPEEAYNIFADMAIGITNKDFDSLELAY